MKIKVCGLYREEDIEYANNVRPDFIGFIIDYPKSHRSISLEKAKKLKDKLNPKIKAVGVFVNKTCEYISKICKENIIDMVQLHGDEDDKYIRNLKKSIDKEIIKAFIVKDDFDSKKAESSLADYILLDGGRGGGEKFSYEKIKDIKRPYFLAGGLSPDNIKEATKSLKIYAVDMSSGLETDKIKDLKKIVSVVKQVHGGEIL